MQLLSFPTPSAHTELPQRKSDPTQNFHRGKAIQHRTRALWHPIPLISSLTEESAAKLDHSKKINFWMSKTTYNYMENITNWRIFLKMLKNMLRNGKLI